VSSGSRLARLGEIPHIVRACQAHHLLQEETPMKWTKPEAEVVAVTMEVTAYVATL